MEAYGLRNNFISELNVSSYEDWYRIKNEHITSRGGERLLNVHGKCLRNLLASVYPDFQWKWWLFERSSKGI